MFFILDARVFCRKITIKTCFSGFIILLVGYELLIGGFHDLIACMHACTHSFLVLVFAYA